MPNTLAHIGAQTLGTRALARGSDGIWILAGCVLPDLPWVLQHVVQALGAFDPYALRFHAVAQASLAGSLVGAAALAALARAPRRAFAVMAFGSLLHLLLDATQTKFGNGVHLLAPVSWELLHLDWYPPESPATVALTLLGVAAWVRLWREPAPPGPGPFDWRAPRVLAAGVGAALWLLLPVAWISGPESSDAHSTTTLRDRSERPGRSVQLDRNRYLRDPEGHLLQTFAGESLRLRGAPLGDGGTASVRGRFVDEQTIEVLEAREHPPGVRDGASLVGLLAVAAYGLRAIRRDPPWGPR